MLSRDARETNLVGAPPSGDGRDDTPALLAGDLQASQSAFLFLFQATVVFDRLLDEHRS